MSGKKRVHETTVAYTAVTDQIVSRPIVLERDGKPAVVLMPYEEYQRLQRIEMDARVRKEMAQRDLKTLMDERRKLSTDLTPEQLEAIVTEEVQVVRKRHRAHRRSS